ncbi:MAG: GNAT family N-acetyltransferase [Bacteroidales bacterium]|nr:GNAT family N-acetyltransferase [Bacteroidales bacterium]
MSSFSCGNNNLDVFFQKEVFICSQCHMFSAYYVLYENDIVAAFTLANDSLVIEYDDKTDVRNSMSENAPLGKDSLYDDYFETMNVFPAINIGHLAVKSDLQSQGIGEYILNYVIYTFLNYSTAGCLFVTVDALNNSRTNNFYCRNGFIFQTTKDIKAATRRMYFPLNIYRKINEFSN